PDAAPAAPAATAKTTSPACWRSPPSPATDSTSPASAASWPCKKKPASSTPRSPGSKPPTATPQAPPPALRTARNTTPHSRCAKRRISVRSCARDQDGKGSVIRNGFAIRDSGQPDAPCHDNKGAAGCVGPWAVVQAHHCQRGRGPRLFPPEMHE